jgi:hypothetical protein
MSGAPIKLWQRVRTVEETRVHGPTGEEIPVLKSAHYQIFLAAPGHANSVIVEIDFYVQPDGKADPVMEGTVPDQRWWPLVRDAIQDRKEKKQRQIEAIIRRKQAARAAALAK